MRSVILFTLILAVHSKEQNSFRGLVSKRNSFALSRAVSSCKEGRRIDCEDCSTVKICGYDKTVVASYQCQDVDPSKPFCTGEGVCSEKPQSFAECNKRNELCPCPDCAGYYPDPTNCTRYLYCDDELLGYDQNCLGVNNVYNQTTASCFLKRRTSDCFQVDCNNARNKDKWFVYTPFPQLYFFCSENGAIMFKCPREADVFDLNLKRCELECREAGRFPHPDPRMYYECAYISTSKIQKYELTCPSSLEFDVEQKKCVVKSSG